jgi:hypothetical protein
VWDALLREAIGRIFYEINESMIQGVNIIFVLLPTRKGKRKMEKTG